MTDGFHGMQHRPRSIPLSAYEGIEELFTRLLYYGLARLHLSQDEVWATPFGPLLDLWECDKQYNGILKPKREHFIDEVIPEGI